MPAFLTHYQAELLMNALDAHEPQTAHALTACTSGGVRTRRVGELTRAGFLTPHKPGRHTRYTLTPAGRELAEYLRRLEAARELD